jgi:hypothetical protein
MAYIDTRTMKFYFCELFLAIQFLLVTKNLRMSQQNGCSFKKGSLGRDKPSVGDLTWQAVSTLLGLASLPSTS